MKLIGTTLVIGLFAFATQAATSVIDNIKNEILKKADEKLESIFLSLSEPKDPKEKEEEKEYTYQDYGREEERYQHPEQYVENKKKPKSENEGWFERQYAKQFFDDFDY